MAHDHHGHSHHHHHHGTGNITTAFVINTVFALVELAGGFFFNSVAVMSNGIHDIGDSLSLGTAWYFQKKSAKTRDSVYTYGYRRFSLLGAFVNSVVLVVGSVLIINESVHRLITPEHADARGMLAFGIAGIVFNGLAFLRLRKGETLNEKIVSLHFIEDILGWVAVLIGAIVMSFVDFPIIDPILSVGIAAFILFNVYRNIRSAFQIILQGVPGHITETSIREALKQFKEVLNVHDIHVWTLDGTYNILTLHVVLNKDSSMGEIDQLKLKIKGRLNEMGVQHATIETELENAHCDLEEC